MSNLRILILAAGKGTRMKSRKAKVLHQVGGLSLIEHVLKTARTLTSDITVVVGHQAGAVRELIGDARSVEQREQHGTGHAVIVAKDQLPDDAGDLLVLAGDVPLIRSGTLQDFIRFHREGQFQASVLTVDAPDPAAYGRIIRRGDDQIDSIVEYRDASEAVRAIPEINSGIYVFSTPALFDALAKVQNENTQKEYYLTDVIGIMTSRNQPVGAYKALDPDEFMGINTRQELAAIDRQMRRRKIAALMAEGVTIIDPESTFIDDDVQIGADSILYPSVQIYGRSVLGDDVTVRSFSRLTNATIGDRSTVLEGCVVVDSLLGQDVIIGPYAHLRPGTSLGDHVKVGNFVEIKKSSLGEGTKSMHLAYLGDATIGKKVNIGAGVITANYDGVAKHPTIIEDGVFIGSDSQLIAPVHVGKGAYVAAGSSITDTVPPDALAIARGRQTVKEGWVRNRKKK